MRSRHNPGAGVMMIELLLAAAIVAILAAIAIPNFLEKQTRSHLAGLRADMRRIGVALDNYKVEQEMYPVDFTTVALSKSVLGRQINFVRPITSGFDQFFLRWALTPLTTPVAYLPSLPASGSEAVGSKHSNGSSFMYDGKNRGPEYATSDYLGKNLSINNPGFPFFCSPEVGWSPVRKWRLRDPGPDRWFNNQETRSEPYYQLLYDPSNGTVSSGDIVRWGPLGAND